MLDGSATIEFEERASWQRVLVRGDAQPVPPDAPHRVTLGDDGVIEVDFLVR